MHSVHHMLCTPVVCDVCGVYVMCAITGEVCQGKRGAANTALQTFCKLIKGFPITWHLDCKSVVCSIPMMSCIQGDILCDVMMMQKCYTPTHTLSVFS